jgi:hypothetical protein
MIEILPKLHPLHRVEKNNPVQWDLLIGNQYGSRYAA